MEGELSFKEQHSSGKGRLRPFCAGREFQEFCGHELRGTHIGPRLRAVEVGKAVQAVGGAADSRPIRCISRMSWSARQLRKDRLQRQRTALTCAGINVLVRRPAHVNISVGLKIC